MKVVIYCRTSKLDQHPENQELQLVEYAKRMGWQFDVFEEQESTRKTRPIKEFVLQKLRQKEYDALLVWKLDRWGRSLQELVSNLQELTAKSVKIVSLQDNIDYTTASGQLFANMLACFAEYERSIIRERTLAGLERAKKQGKQLGRPVGAHDKGVRKKSGYWARWQTKQTPAQKTQMIPSQIAMDK